MSATVAAAVKKIAIYILGDEHKRGKLFVAVGSIIAGFLGLMFLPIAVISSIGSMNIEPPDIPAAHGTPIHASCSGKVIKINTTCTHDYGKEESCGCGGGYGNYVIIDHGNEFITLYGHLTEVDVEIGDEVKKGDVIGKMGSTGFSTGDHLHIEIRYQGYILNPAFYLDVTQ